MPSTHPMQLGLAASAASRACAIACPHADCPVFCVHVRLCLYTRVCGVVLVRVCVHVVTLACAHPDHLSRQGRNPQEAMSTLRPTQIP
eukprot:364150-Chlamydomonas_euryale.AAC.5